MLPRVIWGGPSPAPNRPFRLLRLHLNLHCSYRGEANLGLFSLPRTTNLAPLVRLTSSAVVYILSVENSVVKPCEEIERTLRRNLPELRRRFKVSRIGIFGSVVRGEQRGRSDLDILVEYSETPSILAIVALKRHLTELTGEKVDLVPASALKPAYRQTILNEVVYA